MSGKFKCVALKRLQAETAAELGALFPALLEEGATL
jgi:hypothetical protein